MLQLLIDSSLVRLTGERFSVLETVREYASERLAADSEADAVRVRHARYFANTGETVVRSLQRGDGGEPTSRWLIANAVNIEVANAVLKATGLREDELRSVEPLALAHANSGRRKQALGTLDEYLEAVDLPESQRCRLEAYAAWIAADCGHLGRARELAAAAVARARRVGDPFSEMTALNATGLIASETGDFSLADEAYRNAEALARAHLPQHVPMMLANRALIALERDEFASARAFFDDALELTGGTDADIWNNLALSYLLEGRQTEAEPWLHRTLRHHHEIGATVSLMYALNGYMAFHAGRQPERAARLSGALESLRAELGIRLQHLELRLATQTREVLASRLGDRFYKLEAAGAEMELDDVVALALES